MAPLVADVLVVGGGPVGSLIAYQLARFGCKPLLVEQDDKNMMPCYGRACTLWPRTIELLDTVDMAERLMQLGVVTRSGLHFHEGRRVKGGLMYGSRMDKLGDTFYKFALHLRQRLTEEQLIQALEDFGIKPYFQHRFEGYDINEGADNLYSVTAHVKDLVKDEIIEIKVKYLVGADGGKSVVRKLANISFDGENTKHRWIRMDAIVKTNMPSFRNLNSIDSASHGQILWCPNDNGLTRIGYVFSQKLLEKYGGEQGVTLEVAMEEAKKAVSPFELEFERVDWFTIYGIGQRIAGTFCAHDRVFLAGDACHTHSSGSAQGLNTGVHDAIKLAWKLALCVQGIGKKSLLDSYDAERRPLVRQVIDNDKTISMLISGQYPSRFEGRKEHTREILTEWFEDINMQLFTLGLGISYPPSIVNFEDPGPSRATINPGERAPDVYLTKLGTGDPIRLQSILSNDAKFSIVLFAGNPGYTRSSLISVKTALSDSQSFVALFPKRVFRWFTIPSVFGNGGQEVLGVTPLGTVYLDESVKAHEIYGVDPTKGAIIVFRPDSWVGTVVSMDGSGVERLKEYFSGILTWS
ncbi:FAD/NAD(P)-binding domain-containing protein [Dendrothele bispora CBS 962.96]|uniref:FAD/NAD(P)-binding domain-containing protein n=1 Tax=Dendrothele bispora (strain CBS 962.96) TaxID=1314807 RepID=A0A4S8LVY4_DENBC|nr:FAD/NAD(P)-binding domain-containing protein [Dendrothele bispora CBS 962.96]